MEALNKIAPALVALQADLTPVSKTAKNPFFKSNYAPLSEVMSTVQPLLAKNKLAVSQFMTHIDGESALRTILIHESGQVIEDITPLILTKKDSQAQGSAVTYARRYGVMAVLGLVADEDDDGNKAGDRSQSSYSAPAPRPQASSGNPASDKQLGLLRALMDASGIHKEAINARLATIETSKEASEAIEKMQAKLSGTEEN